MKKLFKPLFIILSLGLVFTACKKDDPAQTNDIPEKEPEYSEDSPEVSKANMEKAGIDFMKELENLPKSDVFVAAKSLSNKLSGEKSVVIKSGFLPTLLSLQSGNSTQEVKSLLKNYSLRADIEEDAGIYTWNSTTGEFVESQTDELMVKYIFPYDADVDDENNCELTLSTELTNVSDTYLSTTEAPNNVSVTFDVKGATLVEYTLDAEYNSDGVPSIIESSFRLEDYTWKRSLNQNTSAASYDYLFTYGDKTLMNTGVDASGNFDVSDIETYFENNIIRNDTSQFHEDNYISEAGMFLQDVKMYYQIMNVKLINLINTKKLSNAIQEIINKADAEGYSVNQLQDSIVFALNKHVNMYLMYTDNSKKIANAEMYMKTVEYEDYNFETQQYDTKEREDVAVQFIFEENGSPVDAEVYFQEGFEDFEAELEDLETELEDLFDTF
ncbi:MAG: hypothetical protein R6U95_02845 [Bacteroidales bacterium]